ncbi:hypothetical protein THRCLA_04010 [Thraustotheca clavata]|uniref:Transmembrane protein 198 n=1 Tax=Thraustotheca clavata TaxID=74557 RepID=A0A1W0A075_9STRA|nr:hypothetical protein THRCLA_04010 [Thraustotheca clavata]
MERFIWVPVCLVAGAVNLTIDGSSSFDKATNSIVHTATSLSLGPSVLAGFGIGLGLVVNLWGYKLFRPVLFLSGFAVGSVLAYLLAEVIFKNQSYATTACWISFLAGGIIAGATVLCIWKWGIFMVGCAAGILLAFLANTSFGYKLWPSNPTGMLYVLIITFALLGGLLARCLERPFLIIATSFLGAACCIWGIGYFAGGYPPANHLENFRTISSNGDYVYSISASWWGYMAATIIMFFFGMFVQFRKTAFGFQHDKQENNDSYVNCPSPRNAQTL